MALSKQALHKLLNNPGMFNPDDMEDEQSDIPGLEQELPVAPEEMLESPVDEAAEVSPEAPDTDGIEDQDGEAMIATNDQESNADQDIMNKLRKLKAGESIDDSTDEQDQEVAQDTQAPIELRKKAMQKIKQKYLGQ